MSLLGPQGVLSLIDLWLTTAENRPKGVLTGMTEQDVALDGQWNGDAGEFCKALLDVGFLDLDEDGVYSIHDWKEHQRFCFYAPERSQRARENVQVRWSKKDAERKQELNTTRIQPVYQPDTPSPSPIPLEPSLSLSKATCPQSEIVDLYHKLLSELPPVKDWTDERQKQLRSRWKEDPKRQDLDWWERYFAFVRKSSFLMGNGSKSWKPNLEWLVKKKNLINVIEGKYHEKC